MGIVRWKSVSKQRIESELGKEWRQVLTISMAWWFYSDSKIWSAEAGNEDSRANGLEKGKTHM